MPPRTRFLFLGFSKSSYPDLSSVLDQEMLLNYLFRQIEGFCVDRISIERGVSPRKVLDELLLICKNLRRKNKKNWYQDEYFIALKNELNTVVKSSNYPFIVSIETRLNLLKKVLEGNNQGIDYPIYLLENLLKDYPKLEASEYWNKELVQACKEKKFNFQLIEGLYLNLINSFVLNGYSLKNFSESLVSRENVVERVNDFNFEQHKYSIDLIFKGNLANKEFFEYKGISVFNIKEGVLPEYKYSRLIKIENESFIGFRIPVTAIDSFSALKTARKKVNDLINTFIFSPTRSIEVEHHVREENGSRSYSELSKPFDLLYIGDDILIHMVDSLEEISNMKENISNRFRIFLRKIDESKGAITSEEAIIDIWIALESLIGEYEEREQSNSRIIQNITPKAYVVAFLYWETENILLHLSGESTSLEEVLNEIAITKGLNSYRSLRRMHLKENKDRILKEINSPYLAFRFNNFCDETNEKLALKMKEIESNIRKDLYIITILRNALVHGKSVNLDCDLLLRRFRLIAGATVSVLRKFALKGHENMKETLLAFREYFDNVLMELEYNSDFEIDQNFPS